MYYFEIIATILLLGYISILNEMFSKNMKTSSVSILIPLISLVLGISIQKKLNFSITSLIIISVILILITSLSLMIKDKKINFLSLIILPSTFGAILIHCQEKEFKSKLKFVPTKNTNIIGEVLEKEIGTSYKETIKIALKKIFRDSNFKYFNNSEKIILYLKNETKISPGDTIIISQVNLSTPAQIVSLNGNPSFYDYAIKENIIATSFANNIDYEIIETQKKSFFSKLIKYKNNFYERMKNKFSKKTFIYFSSIFLGKKTNNLNQEIKNFFLFWGISHYLARSGLHIAIFILIWGIILSLLPLCFIFKQTILITICLIYATISWSSISFLRALTIFMLYKIGSIINKNTNLLYILSITCMFYLCLNPYLLFFLDFQLSFGLTIAITASFYQ